MGPGLVLAVLACGLSAAAGAQTPAGVTTSGPSGVQKVEVVGQTPLPGNKQPLRESPYTVQLADDQDIRASGALDLSEFLDQRFSGVNINNLQGNPLQTNLNYRGFSASPLLGTPQGLSVYVDGVRINQPLGDTVNWDTIPRGALASVALVGGGNPLYGLNSLGGSLVLETKSGRTHPGGSVETSVGSAGRRLVQADFGTALDPGLDLYLHAQTFDETGWRTASPSLNRQFFGKLGWQDGASRLALSVAYSRASLNGLGMQEVSLLAQDYRSTYTSPDNTRNESLLWTLTGSTRLSPLWALSGNLYARQVRSESVNGDVNPGALDQNLYFSNSAIAATDSVYSGGVNSPLGYTGKLTPVSSRYPGASRRIDVIRAVYPQVSTVAATYREQYPGAGVAGRTDTALPYLACLYNAILNDEPNEKCPALLNRSSARQQALGSGLQSTQEGQVAGRGNRIVMGGAFEYARVAFQQGSEFGFFNADRSVSGTGYYADGSQNSENAFDARVDLTTTTRTASLFALDTLSLARDVQVTTGGRYDSTHVVLSDRLSPAGTSGTLNGNHLYRRFNPTLGLAAGLRQGLTAYGSVSQSSRAPTAVELGCADPADPCRLPNAMASDPPLRAVVTQNLELGLRGREGPLRWNVGAFRADNRDDILFVASSVMGSGYFRNFGQTRRQGLEAGVGTRFNSLGFGANATWLDATFRSAETVGAAGNSSNALAAAGFPGVSEIEGSTLASTVRIKVGDRMPLVPRAVVKAYAQWTPQPDWTLGVDMRHVSASYAQGNENNGHQGDGVSYRGSGSSRPYTLTNLSLAWRFAPGWSLSGRINNLFNQEYETAAQLGAMAFNASGALQSRNVTNSKGQSSYPVSATGGTSTAYAMQQSTFVAPGALRQMLLTLRKEFD